MNKENEHIRNFQRLTPVKIIQNQQIAPDTHLLSYTRTHDFEAGQVVNVSLSQEEVPRMYSICSGNNEAEIKILFNLKPNGYLTPRLARVNPGDTLWVSEPFGNFTMHEKDVWWIAAGTGIAPFYSMFRSGLGEKVTLIHGSRTREGFFFSNEFEQVYGPHYIRCSSGDKASGIFTGRLTAYLESLPFLPHDTTYYLCGSAQMVVETRDILIRKGIRYEDIISEIYF